MTHTSPPAITPERRHALVTGGGTGIGAAIAQALVAQGLNVTVLGRRAEPLNAVVATAPAHLHAVLADVTDPAQVAGMVDQITDRFGAPDVLVHNALADFAFNGDARTHLDRLRWADIARQTETAVGGTLNCLTAMQAHWAAQSFGRVITIGTNLMQNPVVPYHDYTAAKGALLAFTRTAAKELGPMGITVNMVSGGLLRTTDASAATPDTVFDIIASQTPLGRVTTPEDMADAVLFFASPWARAVTGQNLIVDGGLVFG